MGNFLPFATDLLSGFFKEGVLGVFKGIFNMFNIVYYIKLIGKYKEQYTAVEWILSILALVLLVAIYAAIVLLIILAIKKKKSFKKASANQKVLIDEIARLSSGGALGPAITVEGGGGYGYGFGGGGGGGGSDEEVKNENVLGEDESRFYMLTQVDRAYEEYTPPDYDNEITLPEICERYRNFACSRMGLFYDIKIIRLFLASFASTRLIILQGISGTGKTSLAYSFGKFLKNDAVIASVQPSWRDRTELFGYFNEFTKRFNETEVLRKMYEATYNENIYVTILDEMNIARCEYYFAEMLSILEMPSRDEWVISLVPNSWPTDPKHLTEGKLLLPDNMWYIGTINNDDSTFAITDKVYDRAMAININEKGRFFDAPDTEPLLLSYKHLEGMFKQAFADHAVSDDNLKKIAELDDYVIEHFRLAFGNRIVKQLKEYVPAYVACGGTEVDGLDYVLCNKIFRKFVALNLSYVRDEIPGLITYLDKLWGKQNMQECKDYLNRLRKLV